MILCYCLGFIASLYLDLMHKSKKQKRYRAGFVIFSQPCVKQITTLFIAILVMSPPCVEFVNKR